MEKYAQTCSTVVWYNIFNAITLFINITIAKAQAQYHTRCQYELVFSKWPTIVKILCGFLPLSAGNSDFLKIKKTNAATKIDVVADDKPGYFLHGLR
jgi:hypothetical protein